MYKYLYEKFLKNQKYHICHIIRCLPNFLKKFKKWVDNHTSVHDTTFLKIQEK